MERTPLPPGKKVFFVSDAHLGVPDRASSLQREKRLVSWLEAIAGEAQAIHLVGDLFDFWFEYRHTVPRGFVRVLGKLAELRDRGISIYAYTGNHDLWMFNYFEEELGIPVFRSPQVWIYNQTRFLVGHGDGIGPGDYGYKFIKRIFSSPVCQWLFARIHPNFGVGMALYWSRKSRQAEQGRDETFLGEAEPQVIYARQVLERDSFRYFLFGHRHCPVIYDLNDESSFVNLGDWINHFSYAVYDGTELQLKHWPAADLTGLPTDNARQSGQEKAVPKTAGASSLGGILLLVCAVAFCGGNSRSCNAQANVNSPINFTDPTPPLSQAPKPGELLFQVPGKFVSLAVDGLGNLFTLSKSGEIHRYSSDGRMLYQFSVVRLGKVGTMDVSNPLRVLVYYPEFLTVLTLTNTLAVTGEIDLRKLGFNKVRAAGLARDGQIWLYDEANFQLVKIDDRGQIARRSEPLNYILGLELQPIRLLEQNDRLFLLDPQHGILVFDAFGTYEYRFGGPGIRHMQVFAEQVIYQNASGYFFYDLNTYFEGPFSMPDFPMELWSLDGRRMALLGPDGIAVFALP